MLAQLSNTEFAILAKGIERPFHAMQLARRIMAEINAPLTLEGLALRPNASIGIATTSIRGRVRNSCCVAPPRR